MAIMENNELREYTGFVYDFFSRSMGTPISNFLFPKKITTDAAMVTGDLIKQNLGGYLAGFVENERAPMGLSI